jgi:glc operon protein GlcG
MSRVITLAVILSAFCLSAEAQTVTVTVLNEAGAEIVLKAAAESARQKSAPSAIAVVDPAGDLLAFRRMDGVRPDSVDLAIVARRGFPLTSV